VKVKKAVNLNKASLFTKHEQRDNRGNMIGVRNMHAHPLSVVVPKPGDNQEEPIDERVIIEPYISEF